VLITVTLLAPACGDDNSDVAAFCQRARDQARFDAVFDGFTVTDRADAHARIATAIDELEQLRDLAPGDLRDELGLLLDVLEEVDGAVDELDPSDPDSVERALAPINERSADIDEANARLETFRQTRCQTPETTDELR
jgi:hypothetical protein